MPPQVSRRARRAVALAGAAACAVSLAGCADFVSAPTASQSGGIGPVHVQTAICLDGFGANSNSELQGAASPWSSGPSCSGALTSESSPTGQLLVGYLVPDGATAPASLSSPDLPGIAFTPSSDYTSFLTDNQSVTSGEHWVGYLSDEITQTAPQIVHLDAAFPVPTGSGGTPFAVQATVGDRADGSNAFTLGVTLPPGRTLDCAETEWTIVGAAISTTGCVEDDQAVSVDTHDLALTAPSAAMLAPGGSVTLPFAVAASGPASSAPTVSLSASSDTAGLNATPADASLTPTGTSTEGVTVTAPASLAPGTYHVTLTATGSCGQSDCTRTATAPVTVAARPTVTPTAPTVTPTTTPVAPPLTAQLAAVSPVTSAGSLFANGVATRIACNQSCAVEVTLLVNHRAQLRGRRWRELYHRYAQAHPHSVATLPAVSPSTQETVVHEIVNLPHAGSRRVILRIAGAQARLLPWAGSIAVGVATYGIDADGHRVTPIARHWQSVSGRSVFQRLRAHRHRHHR